MYGTLLNSVTLNLWLLDFQLFDCTPNCSDLSSNHLSGPLPQELGQLPNLYLL